MGEQSNGERIYKYVNCHVPIDNCNLRCSYCYIRQERKFNERNGIIRSSDFIRNALSKKRLKGTALFMLCGGGETMLCRQLPDIIEALASEGHYIQVVTNGTITKAFEELFSKKINFENILIKLSLHYLELKRLGLLKIFAENFNKIRSMGCSISVEVMACDELVPCIEELKDYSLKNFQAFPHIAPAREDKSLEILTSYPLDEYYEIWEQFDSMLFEYKMKQIVNVKRIEFCKAGELSLQMDLGSGEVYQCVKHPFLDNLYENVNEEIKLRAVGEDCCLPYCYNGHAYLPLGILPEVEAPTYLELRNRKMIEGGEWVIGKMKNILSQRICENDRGQI